MLTKEQIEAMCAAWDATGLTLWVGGGRVSEKELADTLRAYAAVVEKVAGMDGLDEYFEEYEGHCPWCKMRRLETYRYWPDRTEVVPPEPHLAGCPVPEARRLRGKP